MLCASCVSACTSAWTGSENRQIPALNASGVQIQASPSASVLPATPQPVASAAAENSLNSYVLRVTGFFKAQSLDSAAAVILQEQISDFESELSSGYLEAYEGLPDFSVELLAHSEGSFFQTPSTDGAATQLNFARALVIYPDQSYDVFKGQYSEQRFYFSGADTLPAGNTTYLIMLGQDLKPQVLSGQLEGLTRAAQILPTVIPTPETLTLVLPQASASPPPALKRFAPALARQQQNRQNFQRRMAVFQPVPPPPPVSRKGRYSAPPHPFLPAAVIERIRREFPELHRQLRALELLSASEHYRGLQVLQQRYPDWLTGLRAPVSVTPAPLARPSRPETCLPPPPGAPPLPPGVCPPPPGGAFPPPP